MRSTVSLASSSPLSLPPVRLYFPTLATSVNVRPTREEDIPALMGLIKELAIYENEPDQVKVRLPFSLSLESTPLTLRASAHADP